MYYNRFNGGRSGAGRGRFFGGGTRRIKSFDPSSVINTPSNGENKPVYAITHEFNDFAINEELKRNILEKGYKTPTPIQDQAITPLLEGRDLIGIANTGTGKTAAFLIPLIDKVLKDPREQVLIIAPTRELAAQIRDEFISFSRNLRIYCALCIGGAAMARQVRDLRYNPNFVIGTPGRIKDLLRSRYLNLSNFRSIVLDEADHMVDIGFIVDIRYIISLLPKTRQSLFFSATIDGKVREILNSFVQNPVTVSVKTGDTAQNIQQEIVRVIDRDKKIEQLHGLLIKKEFEKVLLFGRTKHGVQKLSDELVRRGFRADAIHGNKKQNQRIRTLEKFKNNQIQILIATDVASRGLDIPNVSHVINYDLPESYDAYIHRIGRTGRADKKGVALTFVGA
jgi:superfamily II DNA/RNA helicase